MISAKKDDSFYELDKRVKLIPLFLGTNKKQINFLYKVYLLKKHFKKNRYDAVISFLPNVNFCVYLSLKHIKGIVHIASERNNPYIDPKSKIRRFFKELAFKKANGVVFQTEDAERYFANKLKCPTQIIKNPVSAVVDDLLLDTRTSGSIVSVGRLTEQKNFSLLINAFYDFNKIHQSSFLKIYGEGASRDKLEELITSLDLTGKVQLCGNSINWIKDNFNCSLFINSSLYEGMPNSLLEAAINGMPCIASDCPIGGNRELLLNGNGLLFINNDKEDLLKKMNILYKNDALVTKFRKASLNMRENYSPKIIALQWVDFIKRLINEKK